MACRPLAIVLAAASLGLLSSPAFAQDADAPAPQAAAPVARHGTKIRKARPEAHPKAPARPAARAAAAPTSAPGAPSIAGGESEAASLERRRKAFFATKPDAAAPEADTPSAGVTLGGSGGGISPGMGFKF